jgi:hypothetical protein
MTVSKIKFIQCGDASLGDNNGPQVEKDGGPLVVLTDMSHACHIDESRRFPTWCDLSGGKKTSRMATVVHDGDVSTGYQLFECETQSGRTSACDEQRRQGRIGGARDRCERGDVVDCVILPKAKLMWLVEEACHVMSVVE